MPAPVTPEFLLEGAAYALEHCGSLLRDANDLYLASSYAHAVVLAAFAGEELGKWKMLLNLRREVLGGKAVTIREINRRCGQHEQKQKADMLSITMTADRESGLGKLLSARFEAPPQSEQRKELDDQLERIDRDLTKRVPGERHNRRMSALYVDALPDGRWNRPATAISQTVAYDVVTTARNDYSVQHSRYTDPASFCNDDELAAALEQRHDRPVLAVPAGPLPLPERRAREPDTNADPIEAVQDIEPAG
jgi:AbiV family abortive infection protein